MSDDPGYWKGKTAEEIKADILSAFMETGGGARWNKFRIGGSLLKDDPKTITLDKSEYKVVRK